MIVLMFFYCLYFFVSPISLLALPGARLIPFFRPYCTTTKTMYAPARRQGGNHIFLLVSLARHAFWQYLFFHFHETRAVTCQCICCGISSRILPRREYIQAPLETKLQAWFGMNSEPFYPDIPCHRPALPVFSTMDPQRG